MRTYTIGEVADLLGLKPHVIRYWEQEVPLLAPAKGLGGRRVYGAREVGLLLRMKRLLHDERYTIEGARQRVWQELAAPSPDIVARIAEIRADLLEAWARIRERRPSSGASPDVPRL